MGETGYEQEVGLVLRREQVCSCQWMIMQLVEYAAAGV